MSSLLRHKFHSISLLTIPPPVKDDFLQLERPPIQEIFTGSLIIKEFLTSGSGDYSSLPRSSLMFEFVYEENDGDIVFCNSSILDNLYKLQEFIKESGGANAAHDNSYDIVVEVLNMRIPLQLKVKSTKDAMALRDLLVRFTDEFELIEDMYYL